MNLDLLYRNFQKVRRSYWDHQVETPHKINLGGYYHKRLADVFLTTITPGKVVLEIGCGEGHLLNALKPCRGVGIDFSSRMLQKASRKYPHLQFILGDAHEICIHGITFDFIILSDLLNDVWDVQTIFEWLKDVSHPGTRIIINTYSRLWELPLFLAEKLHLATPVLNQNWLTLDDIRNFCRLSGLDIIRTWQEVLFPFQVQPLTFFFNCFLAKIAPFNHLCLSNFILARPICDPNSLAENPSVSIVIPARNESGNIERIFSELPDLDCQTEVIFVEGNSRDDTWDAIQQSMARHPEVKAKLFRQTGVGKGDAVRLGFQQCQGDILMILDADLTVPPHYLPRFYEAICHQKGEFINGVRLVYPMEKQAMQFFNLIGNKAFSILFSWLLGQPIKDTLCGTKVLWRKDYEQIARNRSHFGDFDPFGDFDLLYGASWMGLKIIDMPVRYRDRTYGTTNISRWKHGLLLLKMFFFGARRLKFL